MGDKRLDLRFFRLGLCVALIFGGMAYGPAFAPAAITIVVESIELEYSGTAQTGSFEIFVQSDQIADPNLIGQQVMVGIAAGQTGMTLTGGATPTAHPYVFDPLEVNAATLNDPPLVVGGDYLLTGSYPLSNNAGLLKVNFQLDAALPVGTEFDLLLDTDPDNTFLAVEAGDLSFGVTPGKVTIVASQLLWDGGEGVWTDAKWSGGQAVSANKDMVVNAAGGDSVVTVATDFVTGGSGPAKSVVVGESNAATLTVAGGVALEVTGESKAGGFGKIAVENGATLQTASAVIESGGRLIAGVQGSDTGLLDSAGQLSIDEADALQVDWLPGSDASSMFGGTYRIAEYSGSPLATTGKTSNVGSNIRAPYVKNVEYAVDVNGDGSLYGVEVELHPQGLGDTDLDTDVDGDDLATFGLSWNPSGVDNTWFDGDFDFDGDTDGDDLAILGLAWSPGGFGFPAGDIQVTTVPEPGTVAMLLLAAAGLLIYSKRR